MLKATAAALLLLLGAQLCAAIVFTDWAPSHDLPDRFKPFLEALVNAAESRNVTTGYTNYFPADGMQTTLSIHCAGAARIQECKDGFLANGREIVHYPNNTFIYDNNATATVFESQGRIEITLPTPDGKGSCSQQYYKTRYTIFKTKHSVEALANLEPTPLAQVYWYHDYYINPASLSTDIPCDSRTRGRSR